MDLSKQIRAARGERSREEFAYRVGASLATVIRWEAGQTKPTSHPHIERLAAEGVPLEALTAASTRSVAA